MKTRSAIVAISIFFLPISVPARAEIINFFPSNDSKVTIRINTNEVEIINGDAPEKKIEFDTEKTLNIEISDYNFDKNLDFPYGTPTMGRVYMTYIEYSYTTKKLRPFPKLNRNVEMNS